MSYPQNTWFVYAGSKGQPMRFLGLASTRFTAHSELGRPAYLAGAEVRYVGVPGPVSPKELTRLRRLSRRGQIKTEQERQKEAAR